MIQQESYLPMDQIGPVLGGVDQLYGGVGV